MRHMGAKSLLIGIEVGQHAAVKDGDDQHAVAGLAVEHHMRCMLVTAEARSDLIGRATPPGMVC